MFLLKIPLTEPNPPPRIGTQFSFAMFYHEGGESVVRNPEVVARNPGGSCNVCSKRIDGEFTGLAIGRNILLPNVLKMLQKRHLICRIPCISQ
jgi:hypothetical protein